MSVRRRTYRDRKSGAVTTRWVVDIDLQHPDGRRERVRKISPIRSYRGAEQYERELRASLLAGTYGKKKEIPTFAEFVTERWLATYPTSVGNRPSSIREKEIHVRIHLLPVLGRLRLDKINGEVVARLFARLRTVLPGKKALAEKTIKNIRATMRRILASAKDWGEIAALPDLPRVKAPESSWDFFTWEETERLLATCRDDEERALLMFAVHTGARAGEQLALQWGDIDWYNHLVVFRRSSTRGIVGPTKSGRERKVPLTTKLEAALRKIKHLRSDRVFCNPDGSPYRLGQLHERFWTVSRRAGLRRLRWHDLRHSFGSQAAISGVPIIQVQQWMGHSTIAMTMRYAHLAPGAGAAWIRMLEAPANPRHSDGTSGEIDQKQSVSLNKVQ
jgi:integrase